MSDFFPWDSYSDQPHILEWSLKKELRKGHVFDYIKLMVTNLIFFPYLFLKFRFLCAFDEIEPTDFKLNLKNK